MEKGNQTIIFEKSPVIIGTYSIVGPMEGKGPFGTLFDHVIEKPEWDEPSFEKAECKMHRHAIIHAIEKAGLDESDIDSIISGDLLNQMITSSYSVREFDCTYLGLYSACSTIAEAMTIGSLLISGKHFKNIACVTSSHFCSAERQYRYPLELGTPRTPLSQWTVTGAGCMILSDKGIGPKITMATLGKVIDYKISDVNNMGAAMAPAAAHTIITHFKETKRMPVYYDAIVTGDLGKYGSELLLKLLKDAGLDVASRHFDCGAKTFGDDEKKYQGGSGAGCCNVMFCSYFYNKLKKREINKILFIPTGALMSKISSLQGESIPAIAQAVAIENME